MAKLTLNTIGSRYGSIDALNDNFDAIETAFENTLSRDGTGPNNMEADLDMDSNNIINVGDISVGSLRIGGVPVSPGDLNYTGMVKETVTATSGQTVFNLSTVSYSPLTNNLSVYVDGVYQNPSRYTETSSTRVTLSEGVHEGAVVDFVVLSLADIPGTVDAANVTYTPAGTGALTTTVQTKLRETVSVKDFGAVGDGVTDDTAAIQAAADAISGTRTRLWFPSGSYKCGQLDLTGIAYIVCDGLIKSTATSSDGYAVLIGNPGFAAFMNNGNIQLFVEHNNGDNAGLTGLAGISVRGAENCQFALHSYYFEYGFAFNGTQFDHYVALCTFNQLRSYGCRVGQYINPTGGCFFNDNVHYGVQGSKAGNVLPGDQIGVHCVAGAPNNNVWIKPSYEGTDVPIKLDSGIYNRFIQPRLEVAGSVYFGPSAGANIVEASYPNATQKVTYDASTAWYPNVGFTSYLGTRSALLVEVTFKDWLHKTATVGRNYVCQKLVSNNYGSGASGPNYFEYATADSTARTFTILSNDYAYFDVEVNTGDLLETECDGRYRIRALDASKGALPSVLSTEQPYFGSSFINHANGTSYTGSVLDFGTSATNRNAGRQVRVNRSEVKYLRYELLSGIDYSAFKVSQVFDDSQVLSGLAARTLLNDIKYIDSTSDTADRFGQMGIVRGTSTVYINLGGTTWVAIG